MFSKENFRRQPVSDGMFFALIIAMFVNSFISLSGLGLITIGIGTYGVVAWSTQRAMSQQPEYDNPGPGALMLFGAV